MNAKLTAMLCTNKRIEAIYEVDTESGGFATVVCRSDGQEELYPHCKIETVLDVLAACKGKTLPRLRLLRGKERGNYRQHIDYYTIDLGLILMPVRQRRAVNTGHGVMAYLNVARILGASESSGGGAELTFLSGKKLHVLESATKVRSKIDRGKKLLYDDYHACEEELHYMRITMRRMQHMLEAGL